MIGSIMEFFYIMLAVSFVNLVFGTIRHQNGEALANSCVYDFREMLYRNFIRQDLGFFDERMHTPSVLIATMAEQTDKVL